MNTELQEIALENCFDDQEEEIDFLNDAWASGDADIVRKSLLILAKKKGMQEISKDSGLARSSVYKALSDKGNPKLDTFINIILSLNIKATFSV
ncbi:addiction module antidote protein [Acetobacter indonesiensis]|uniref:addiction module antidote protein n=1 Tax=Acetobacter indonesiensis TaxID=104101 RepID=UPI000A363A73|nr:addiction module antidote protein [Acetobacter indonesiensis]